VATASRFFKTHDLHTGRMAEKQANWKPPDLAGKVALVAGATRGAGRGIATALGEAGATVYCTGRTTRAKRSAMGRSETIEETAERVTAAGGIGIAVRADHGRDDDVRRLVDRIEAEHEGLDVLVNDVWGGDPHIAWGQRFWQIDMDAGWAVVDNAVRTHLVTARRAAPLLIRRRGLLVEITDGDHFAYRGHLVYDLVKTSIIRIAYTMHHELAQEGAAAVAVTPGFLRSEAMLDHFGVTEANWRDAARKAPDFIASETPLFVGRGVACLAADPQVARRGGRVVASWTLSDEYGFPDADGARPHWGRHFAKRYGQEQQPALDETFYRYWKPMRELEDVIPPAQPEP
jgi:NAD(P)-dependent dehydrogenase (short-subunit alcohol dehydrogenase family)